MKLNPGVMPAEVIRQLREQVKPVVNGGLVYNSHVLHVLDDYLSWASDMERLLVQLFHDPELDQLHTTRYWNIRSSGTAAPRLIETVRDEGAWQAQRLRRIAYELEEQLARLQGDPDARIAVVDTNVFLHCQPLEDFDWSFVAHRVRVVVPIRVVMELDDKKRDRVTGTADRARGAIRWLREVAGVGSSAHVLKNDATIEVYVPPGPRALQPSADTEILETCEALETFTQKPLTIVTSDYGMELRGLHYRATASGFAVAPVPERHRSPGI